jgi:hypothetical protein
MHDYASNESHHRDVLQDIDISLALVFEDNFLKHEKIIHLPSTKLEDSFNVNKKTFETFLKQS